MDSEEVYRKKLQEKYKGRIKVCSFDKRALEIQGITFSELSEICEELHCSGHLANDNVGFVLNFGKYE